MKLFRTIVLTILCAVLFQGCATGGFKTADLIFVGVSAVSEGDSSMSSAIADATGKGEWNYVHVAIVECVSDSVFVIDATPAHGVSRRSLQAFLEENADADRIELCRLNKSCDASSPALKSYVANAKKFIGEEYDFYYCPDNGLQYCSELVYDSFINGDKRLFTAIPMNFKNSDGEFPEFWVKLYESLGEDIPQGCPGTNPADLHDSPSIHFVRTL